MSRIWKISINIGAMTANKIELNDGKSIIKPIDINKKITINFDVYGMENENTERIWAHLKFVTIIQTKIDYL